MDHVTDIFEP